MAATSLSHAAPVTPTRDAYQQVPLPVGGISLGGWLFVGLAVLADLAHWAQIVANRQNGMELYHQYSPVNPAV